MGQLYARWRFERVHIAALWIHPRHDVPDGPILAACIQRLEHDEQRVPFVGIKQVLQLVQPDDRLLVRFVVALYPECIVGIAVFQPQFAPVLDNAVFRDIHGFSVTVDRTIAPNRYSPARQKL
jgi:hypothetical protein